MGFYISRQRDYNDNRLYIEIACGGPKKAGPDILTARYDGEQKNLVDPRDAINAAERIYKHWERDYWDEKKFLKIKESEKNILVLEFSSKGVGVAHAWADKMFADMDKCGNCGKPMGSKDPYEIDDIPNKVFCTEACCARKYRDMYGKEPPRIISSRQKKVMKK